MKDIRIILAFVCAVLVVAFLTFKYMPSNSPNQPSHLNTVGYAGKLEEIINFIDNPIISINDITITYTGRDYTPIEYEIDPAIEKHLPVIMFYMFTIKTSQGKSLDIVSKSVTTEVTAAEKLLTAEGCYSLEINSRILFGVEKLKGIPDGNLRLIKVAHGECDNKLARDLR